MSTDFLDLSFLNGANAPFMAELYARYLGDPSAVDASWRSYFDQLHDDAGAAVQDAQGPSWAPRSTRVIGAVDPSAPGKPSAKAATTPAHSAADVRAATLDSLRAIMLIRAYRIRGHLRAKLDPLGLDEPTPHPELEPETYGFTAADWDRPIFINHVLGLETATLREIMDLLEATYCASIGVEFMHIQDPAQKAWIQERIEQIRNQTDFTDRGKRAILDRLTAAECFEKFLAVKYVGTKRFGLDGSESLIPALEQILKRGSQIGLEEVVLGMAHRGRLNVLCNFMDKPFRAIISEFLGNPANPEDAGGSGDVKYHMGVSADREFDEVNIHLTLNANPSHLEIVNPVVLGRVRAKQVQRGDRDRKKVMGILLHGDAAFAGQGVVAETFDFSDLRGYRTGGTIHIIVNNQIGFTTSPHYSRSSPYPTDVAKMVMAPIFHVNADDPEAVVHVARIATEFRQEFGVDVVVDMICYRRFGHNEGDEPTFTQPQMYAKIAAQPSTRQIYADQLTREGVIAEGEGDRLVEQQNAYLAQEFEAGLSYKPNKADWLEGKWSGMKVASGDARRGETAVALDELKRIGERLCDVPADFDLNRKLTRFIEGRRKAIEIRRGRGLVVRRGAGVRDAAGRGRAGAVVGPGFRSRHLLAAPLGLHRPDHRGALCPAEPRPGRAGAVRGHRQPAVGGRRARVRVRLQPGRAELAGAVGGAVRRLRQRRPGDRRPVRVVGRGQVAAHVGPGHAAAARLRGPGAGAFLGPAGALSPAVRRGQHAGGQLHHPGELLPRAAAPDQARLPQAADRDDPEVAAAAQAVRLDRSRRWARARPSTGCSTTTRSCATTRTSSGSCCAPARSTTTSTRSGRSAASRTCSSCASSSSTRSRRRRCCTSWRGSRRPRWCGARRSPRTWGRGPTSTAGWKTC